MPSATPCVAFVMPSATPCIAFVMPCFTPPCRAVSSFCTLYSSSASIISCSASLRASSLDIPLALNIASSSCVSMTPLPSRSSCLKAASWALASPRASSRICEIISSDIVSSCEMKPAAAVVIAAFFHREAFFASRPLLPFIFIVLDQSVVLAAHSWYVTKEPPCLPPCFSVASGSVRDLWKPGCSVGAGATFDLWLWSMLTSPTGASGASGEWLAFLNLFYGWRRLGRFTVMVAAVLL